MITVSLADWISSVDAIRRDEHHRYHHADTVVPVSVTGVLAALKPPQVLATFEATRHEWECRGRFTHQALELAIDGAITGEPFDIGYHPPLWDFDQWILPLIDHPIWPQVEVIASETMMVSADGMIAGTFDGAYQVPGTRSQSDPSRPLRFLFDLKTQKHHHSTSYDIRPQLGGYLALAQDHGIYFDAAIGIWARPGRCSISRTPYGITECLDAWHQALEAYRAKARTAGAAVDDPLDLLEPVTL